MKKTSLPSLLQIKHLISFLPRLYAEGFSPVLSWEGGGKGKDGTYALPYPKYNPVVEEFVGFASKVADRIGSMKHGFAVQLAAKLLG